jgi:NADH-quinone oxidoreductase subunit A
MTALALGVDLIFVLGMVLFFSFANKLFGPIVAHEGDGLLPYETGMPPIENATDNMSVLYWRFAVLFVVFDVDLAFLLPYAMNRGALNLAQAASVTIFLLLMLLMLAYFWRKGVLECN